MIYEEGRMDWQPQNSLSAFVVAKNVAKRKKIDGIRVESILDQPEVKL